MRSAPPSTMVRGRAAPGDATAVPRAGEETAGPEVQRGPLPVVRGEARNLPEARTEPERTVEVALTDARFLGLLRHNCPASGFLREAASALHGGDDADAEGTLHRHYSEMIPETAADVLGLPDTHELADYPPMAALLPWMPGKPGAQLVATEAGVRRYCLLHGLEDYGVTDGCMPYGPISRRMLRHEVTRLRGHLLTSVSDPTGELVRGSLIEDDRTGRQVLDMREGMYACAALAALGYQEVRAWVSGPVVRRSQSVAWHGVQSGLFTGIEALDIFDKYVAGVL